MKNKVKKINKTRQDTQIKFYKVLASPLLMYGSRNWALKRSERRAGLQIHRFPDQVRNTAISNALQIHKKNSGALIRQRTIPTERPPLVSEISANFSG
jgi:hypothetical protein